MPVSATFTYNGQLKNGGANVNGLCDMAFQLYDDPSAGLLIGNQITLTTVPITNGLFTVDLNFGNTVFKGNARWLAISVNCGSGFTALSPRQPLTAVPYAFHAVDAWSITGNSGINSSSNFLGTTDTQPLVIRTNNSERLRVLSAGNVGIGTNSPCANTTLHVYSGASGVSCTSDAILGEGSANVGVAGLSDSNDGVYGQSNSAIGVYGYSNSNTGVIAASTSGTYLITGMDLGANNRRFAVERATGNILADGSVSGPADFAEMMTVTGLKINYTPGDVLVIGPDGKLMLSDKSNATNLVGVYSAKPGFLGDTEIADHGIEVYDSPPTQQRIAVALIGIVPVKVTDENGSIQPGDLLVASSTPGHAMKAKPVVINGVAIYPTGTILGKALESWKEGTGVIKVLITLR